MRHLVCFLPFAEFSSRGGAVGAMRKSLGKGLFCFRQLLATHSTTFHGFCLPLQPLQSFGRKRPKITTASGAPCKKPCQVAPFGKLCYITLCYSPKTTPLPGAYFWSITALCKIAQKLATAKKAFTHNGSGPSSKFRQRLR